MIIKQLSIITLYLYTIIAPVSELSSKIIMINPAGHATAVGRKLSEGYERAETLKFAEKLQEELLNNYQVNAILTRSPGEQTSPLQIASFANRLSIDFFLSLHLYREKSAKPKMYLYQLVYNPLVDFAHRTINPLAFVPLLQAHFKNIHTSQAIALQMQKTLTHEKYQKQFDLAEPSGIPLKPLVGITAPALALEIGINDDSQLISLVEPIVESLNFLSKQ